MKHSLSVIYFPFTFMSARLAELLSCCFHRVTVYQPVGSICAENLQHRVDSGFLDIRIPYEDVVDKKCLMFELHKFQAWGTLNQDADLAYLKEAGNNIAPVDPIAPRIASEIRGAAEKTREELKNNHLSLQLFLHLAQDFDRQSWELREELNSFRKQHHMLQAYFRADSEESQGLVSEEPFPDPDEDLGGFMIENRMVAWNYLFQRDPPRFGFLLTDSPLSLAYLIESIEKKFEILNFEIPCLQTLPEQPRQKDDLEAFFYELLASTWDNQLHRETEQRAFEMRTVIEAWKNSTTHRDENIACFRWYLVPNQEIRSLLDRKCGTEGKSAKHEGPRNALVGLVKYPHR